MKLISNFARLVGNALYVHNRGICHIILYLIDVLLVSEKGKLGHVAGLLGFVEGEKVDPNVCAWLSSVKI